MRLHYTLLFGAIAPVLLHGQTMNPMAIPPALDMDTFQLTVGEHVHQFYPGVNTNTYGVNGPYLGPTLIFHTGDTARLRVTNELQQVTNMHWHGLGVPGDMDGGPPREILTGEHWDVKFKVENPAGTFWYHPHPHLLTATQATRGVAGFILIKDDEEAALELPRTYGVDDIPVVVQDRYFLPNGNFSIGPYGDSVLVNGTPNAYLECPAQVVRLRFLNGSNARVYPLGFEDGRTFSMIAGDGGLLNAPVEMDRIWLSNGERAELLLDLTGLEGDSLLLMSFGSELPQTVPGSNNLIWESSYLNGIDFPVLRIRITPPTSDPETSIPDALGTVDPPAMSEVTNTRVKVLAGNGMVGMGMFTINGQMFDLDVINDTIQLGAIEIWELQNVSNMAHPMHIHGGSFFVLDRDGIPPPASEQGAKDVILVDVGETVRVIMAFEHPSDGWPFMYHCHNLLHEDNMMMLQYIVTDPSLSVDQRSRSPEMLVYPSPTSGEARWVTLFPADELLLIDGMGRVVIQRPVLQAYSGTVNLRSLTTGTYVLLLRSSAEQVRSLVVKE